MKYGDIKHDTEDKKWWVDFGERKEKEFIENICPKIGLTAKLNPQKKVDPTAPDLFVGGKIAELKYQGTPFFTASRYSKDNGGRFDPRYTATFNWNDFRRYKNQYPDIDIYFWVNWEILEYKSKGGIIKIKLLKGIWLTPFQIILEGIKNKRYPLHHYLRRKNDTKGNAKSSYLLELRDFKQVVLF